MLEIVFSIVHILPSAEWLWGTCMQREQYNQHALHVNDKLCCRNMHAVAVSVGV